MGVGGPGIGNQYIWRGGYGGGLGGIGSGYYGGMGGGLGGMLGGLGGLGGSFGGGMGMMGMGGGMGMMGMGGGMGMMGMGGGLQYFTWYGYRCPWMSITIRPIGKHWWLCARWRPSKKHGGGYY